MFNSGKDPPSVYKVITVVTPPGLFFQDPSVADDAQFTLKHDWEKPYNAPTFQDGFRRFRDKPSGHLLCGNQSQAPHAIDATHCLVATQVT